MHGLLRNIPNALYWGLPDYMRHQNVPARSWQQNAVRKDTSAGAVLNALETAYKCAVIAEHGKASDDDLTALAGYAEMVLEDHELENNPWNVLIAGVEIPAVLSAISSNNAKVRQLMSSAALLLNKSADLLFDNEGVIKARYFPKYAAIVATWTRCFRALRSKQVNLKLKKRFVTTYEWSVRQLLLCSTGRRSITTLSADGEIKLAKPFVALMLELGGDISDKRLANRLGFTQQKISKQLPDHYLPDATLHSSDSGVTVMRTGWGQKRREVYLRVDRHDLYIDVASGGRLLFQGNIRSELIIDGVTMPPLGSWEEVCWESDDDADYLELEIRYSAGWKIQKHLLLTKDDKLLLTGDVVLNKDDRAQIQLKQKIQCADGIKFFPAEEHSEGFVWSDNPEAMLIPLALSEWRTAIRNGKLDSEDGLIHYHLQADQASGLYAPLLFVLNGKSGLKEYTWRQLTIAEQLDIQPDDVASGYRIQIGKKQWLLYRSLTEFGNRTVLGQNYSSEFAFGEFREDGTVYEYVEIE